ncbi:hypothetical protein EMIHUDRAFT_451070 [Emiliania huxleyi CCMP1516]|uniref:Uncharacterized protein n=2 Tax=Emiliania huxleyi TaxID=2903 RepID=A0A0D3J962_EMIH1|nr:hypothetical protein EMIHUDRAFT_451070 [Emiliania huxleyi CCMP1516]EOD20047.1 hypothetical protein EMIHUDRAFT_451070 [Emiliania huxleyi CCMP1516]|eukprot:XP_005772476.1 hypothetical protein EMIHUDRAFT_451070 [Emiliania huxleyi CCMP1516]
MFGTPAARPPRRKVLWVGFSPTANTPPELCITPPSAWLSGGRMSPSSSPTSPRNPRALRISHPRLALAMLASCSVLLLLMVATTSSGKPRQLLQREGLLFGRTPMAGGLSAMLYGDGIAVEIPDPRSPAAAAPAVAPSRPDGSPASKAAPAAAPSRPIRAAAPAPLSPVAEAAAPVPAASPSRPKSSSSSSLTAESRPVRTEAAAPSPASGLSRPVSRLVNVTFAFARTPLLGGSAELFWLSDNATERWYASLPAGVEGGTLSVQASAGARYRVVEGGSGKTIARQTASHEAPAARRTGFRPVVLRFSVQPSRFHVGGEAGGRLSLYWSWAGEGGSGYVDAAAQRAHGVSTGHVPTTYQPRTRAAVASVALVVTRSIATMSGERWIVRDAAGRQVRAVVAADAPAEQAVVLDARWAVWH